MYKFKSWAYKKLVNIDNKPSTLCSETFSTALGLVGVSYHTLEFTTLLWGPIYKESKFLLSLSYIPHEFVVSSIYHK